MIKSNSNAFSISFPSFLRELRVSSIQKNAQRQNFEQVRVSSIHETPVTLSDTNRLKPSKERLFLATHIDLFVCFVLQPCHYILPGSLDLTKIKRVPIKNFRHDNLFFVNGGCNYVIIGRGNPTVRRFKVANLNPFAALNPANITRLEFVSWSCKVNGPGVG